MFFFPSEKLNNAAAADAWMQHVISRSGSQDKRSDAAQDPVNNNPYAELEKYLNGPVLLRTECPDVIVWWGVSVFYLSSMSQSFAVTNTGTRLSSHPHDG